MADRRKNCDEKCARKYLDIGSPKLRGAGKIPSKILFVGEAPGQEEDALGQPFVGSSGQLLNELLSEVGINREKVYITNAVKCATPVENQKPGDREVKACSRYLKREIKVVKPNVICALGAVPMKALTGRTGITKLKNTILYTEDNIKVIPVFHPAYILRNPGLEGTLRKGLQLVKEEAKSAKEVPRKKIRQKRFDADTPEKIDKVLSTLESKDAFAFDLETTSLNVKEAKILCLGVSWGIGVGVTIQWDKLSKVQLARVKKIFASKKEKAGHNIKYDMQVFLTNGVVVKRPWFDTLPAIQLINENFPDKGLDTLTLHYTDMGEYWKPLDEFKAAYIKEHKIKKEEFNYGMIPWNILRPYAQSDADASFRLYRHFKKELQRQKLMDFYRKYTIPTLRCLMQMEYRGIKIDREKLFGLIEETKQQVAELYAEIENLPEITKFKKNRALKHDQKLRDAFAASKTLASRFDNVEEYIKTRLANNPKLQKERDFNPRSTDQLAELLFNQLGLPIIKYTDKKKPSTDESVLNELAEKHDVQFVRRFLDYRGLTKYLSTYLESVYKKSEFDGRIHPNYHQHRTVTGRNASSDPNFQNIPRDAKDFKKCFIADPGMTIVKADLAQAEFRCWAHYSADQEMLNDIHSGLDIHRRTASEVFSVPEDEVTSDQRTAAKNCVTGNTWIPTNKGFKQIQELKVGDVVLDHYNWEREVLETIKKEEDVYLVDTESGGIRCTANHPFYFINEAAELVRKPLSDFAPGDYLLSCVPKNKCTEYVTWKYTGPRRTSFKPLFNTWTLDPTMGWLLGFIAAEGSISEKKSKINARWSQKGKHVEFVDKLSTNLFGARVGKRIDKRTGVITWYVSSLEFVEFLKHCGMCTDNKKGFKKFPDKIMESPADVQKAFLQGYFLGDGTFKNHTAAVGSVSKELCDGVCLLLRNFGIYPKIHVEHPKGGETFYNIHVTTKEELRILLEKIEVYVPSTWSYPHQDNGKKFLHNVNDFYQTNHPDGDVRYHTKLRKHITHAFIKKNCHGVNKVIDKLIEHGIHSVRINSITKLGKDTVYDFVTTGDKVMVANAFFTHDCVFGLMYGRGSKAIAEQYGISIEEAEEVRNLFFKKYPMASIWLDKQVAFAKEYSYVKSWMGRIRRLPEINAEDHMVRAEAERQAKNSPIQALASDMNNHYMTLNLKLARKKGIKVYPIGTIHDANLYMVKTDQVPDMMKIMKTVVKKAFPEFLCEMKLDFEVGTTLGTLEEVA